MPEDQVSRYARELLLLFRTPRQHVWLFGRSPAFLIAARRNDPPSVGELVLLTLRRVPSAGVLPVGLLIDDLTALAREARTGADADLH
ncbi:hypothetical protein [Deinococcus pimensis]|uniref:hypothetical protein n=1 Tax=Deinococcus pimensis TaxID=309888 RepID=UPI00047FF3C3|nr:hypothetical protein [Deinococcus pimensis]